MGRGIVSGMSKRVTIEVRRSENLEHRTSNRRPSRPSRPPRPSRSSRPLPLTSPERRGAFLRGKGEKWDAFRLRSRTSQSDPLGLRRAETFWNSRSHGLATVVPWSVPAFCPRSASADTSLLRSCSRNPKASMWKAVISRGERGILQRQQDVGVTEEAALLGIAWKTSQRGEA